MDLLETFDRLLRIRLDKNKEEGQVYDPIRVYYLYKPSTK
jgi:hypothetical protein